MSRFLPPRYDDLKDFIVSDPETDESEDEIEKPTTRKRRKNKRNRNHSSSDSSSKHKDNNEIFYTNDSDCSDEDELDDLNDFIGDNIFSPIPNKRRSKPKRLRPRKDLIVERTDTNIHRSESNRYSSNTFNQNNDNNSGRRRLIKKKVFSNNISNSDGNDTEEWESDWNGDDPPSITQSESISSSLASNFQNQNQHEEDEDEEDEVNRILEILRRGGDIEQEIQGLKTIDV